MLRLRGLLTILSATLFMTIVPCGMSQTPDDGRPKTVQYNGQNYLVEQSPSGFALKITPEGTPVPIGIVDTRRGRITALNPNNYDLVKGVYDAYKSSGSTFAPPDPAGIPPRSVTAPTPPAGAETGTASITPDRIVFPPDGGAIVKGTAFGDITFNSDGTRAVGPVQKTANPVTGETTIQLIAEYKGGDHPGKKTGSFLGGGARAVLQSANTHVVSHTDVRGNDEWVASQITNGKKADMFGTGEVQSASVYTPRIQDPNKDRAVGFFKSVYEAEQAAMDEAAKRRAKGDKVDFDPASTPAGQNAMRELQRFETK